MKAALPKLLCASWQFCQVQFMRNVLAQASKPVCCVVLAYIATAFGQETMVPTLVVMSLLRQTRAENINST
jgi:hypothetical protein